MKWLMLQDDIDRIEALEANAIKCGHQLEAIYSASTVKPNIKRGVARIEINGPMFNSRRPFLEMFGVDHAVYPDLMQQISSASKAGAKSFDFYINSGGGDEDGLYDLMSAIANIGVPTRTITNGKLASAAYMVASQTGEIIATNEVVKIGSVGVRTSASSEKAITNSDSPKKAPDTSTPEGKAVIVETLDDVYQPYAELIARGRHTSIDAVKKDYGQGAVMTARTALSKGMIDGIMDSNQPAKPAAKIGARMDIATLKAEHPDTYAGIFALGEAAGSKKAADDAKSDETKRVMDHLKLAEMSGDMVKAQSDIENGVAADMSAMIHHQTAKAKRDELAARDAENATDVDGGAGAADGGTAQVEAAAIAAINAKYEGAMVI